MSSAYRDRLIEYRKACEKQLKPSRFEHSIGVAYTAMALAMKWGADVEKAGTAGYLHDWAKGIKIDEQIRICRKELPDLPESIYISPAVLHAPLGAHLLRKEFGIKDEEILSAVRYHTTGRPDMSLLEMILFVADYIEPGREQIAELPEMRKLAFEDLTAAATRIMALSLAFLERSGRPIDEMTQKAYDYYKNIRKDT